MFILSIQTMKGCRKGFLKGCTSLSKVLVNVYGAFIVTQAIDTLSNENMNTTNMRDRNNIMVPATHKHNSMLKNSYNSLVLEVKVRLLEVSFEPRLLEVFLELRVLRKISYYLDHILHSCLQRSLKLHTRRW